MERASRLIVIASMALAAVADGWLAAAWQPALAPAALTAALLTFIVARVSMPLAIGVVSATAYVAPALLSAAFHSTDYHVILVWLAAACGPVLARAGDRGWHLPGRWLIALVGWALVVALTWPIVAARELDFSLIAATTMTTAQGVFAGPPPLAAAFVVIFALGQMVGILWLDLLAAEFSGGISRFCRAAVVPFVAGACVGAGAGVYQSTVDIGWQSLDIWSTANRAAGLMLDANSFGTGAAIWAPVTVAAAWATGRHLSFAAGAYALLAVGMWTSSSRTALVTLATGTIGLVVGELSRRGHWQPRVGRLVALAAVVAFIVAAATIPRNYESSNPIGRAFARVPRLEADDMKRFADELWNRFGYGVAAEQIVREHPLTGIGVGAFHVIAPDYIFRASGGYRRVGSDNAQNWWRHQVAELGAIGALPSMCMSVLLIVAVVRPQPAGDRSGVSPVLRLTLIGVGIVSLVGMPMQHPATFVSLATVLFFLAESTSLFTQPHARGRGWWLLIAAIAVATAIGQASTATRELRVPHRAARSGIPYSYGLSAMEGLSDSGALQWMAPSAVNVVRVEAPWYQLTFWHPRPQSSDAVTVTVVMDGRHMLTREVRGAEPVSVYLPAPRGRAWTTIELAARPGAGAKTLGVATRWLITVPPDTPPDRVVR